MCSRTKRNVTIDSMDALIGMIYGMIKSEYRKYMRERGVDFASTAAIKIYKRLCDENLLINFDDT